MKQFSTQWVGREHGLSPTSHPGPTAHGCGQPQAHPSWCPLGVGFTGLMGHPHGSGGSSGGGPPLPGSCAPTFRTAAHFIVAEFAQHSILLLWVVELGASLICGKGGRRCQTARASTQDHTRRAQIPNSSPADPEMLGPEHWDRQLADAWDSQAPNSQIPGTSRLPAHRSLGPSDPRL